MVSTVSLITTMPVRNPEQDLAKLSSFFTSDLSFFGGSFQRVIMSSSDSGSSSYTYGSGSGSTTINLEGLPADVLLSFSIMLMLVLLGLTVSVAYIFQRTKFRLLHETFVAILFGALVGLLLKLIGNDQLQELTQFNTEVFFFLLLPPIIFSSGFDLRRRNFFKNFGGILSFAFIGTSIATFVTGAGLYGFLLLGVDGGGLTLIDCLIFGALISATDPVTVLAIFHAMHVDPKVFALVFGESIMNDAVAIVLFDTLTEFKDSDITFGNIMLAFGSFVGIFFGSFAIGITLGCFAALTFKHTHLYEYPGLESTAFVIFAYISFLLPQAVGASGIVSLLFCGIAMSHYTLYNMSLKSQQTTKYMFQLIAFMAENFIFSYIGLSIFTHGGFSYKPLFILCSFLVIMVARACNIVPISFVMNLLQKKQTEKLTLSQQTMLWWAGLRGALAFSLALKVTGTTGEVVLTTTLVIVIGTVVLFGSSTSFMLEKLGIPVGVVEDDRESTSTEKAHWFVRFDRKYIKGFLMTDDPPAKGGEFIEHEQHNSNNSNSIAAKSIQAAQAASDRKVSMHSLHVLNQEDYDNRNLHSSGVGIKGAMDPSFSGILETATADAPNFSAHYTPLEDIDEI